MSYTIDVYRNEAPAQKDIISLSTFVTLFPQLVAGPIVRYSDISYDFAIFHHPLHYTTIWIVLGDLVRK